MFETVQYVIKSRQSLVSLLFIILLYWKTNLLAENIQRKNYFDNTLENTHNTQSLIMLWSYRCAWTFIFSRYCYSLHIDKKKKIRKNENAYFFYCSYDWSWIWLIVNSCSDFYLTFRMRIMRQCISYLKPKMHYRCYIYGIPLTGILFGF